MVLTVLSPLPRLVSKEKKALAHYIIYIMTQKRPKKIAVNWPRGVFSYKIQKETEKFEEYLGQHLNVT